LTKFTKVFSEVVMKNCTEVFIWLFLGLTDLNLTAQQDIILWTFVLSSRQGILDRCWSFEV